MERSDHKVWRPNLATIGADVLFCRHDITQVGFLRSRAECHSQNAIRDIHNSRRSLGELGKMEFPIVPISPGDLAMSLRQAKPVERGMSLELRNLSLEPCGYPIPPGRAGPAARSESCVVAGRPTLRSVDSQVKGRVIEPRKLKTPGAFVVDIGGGRVRRADTWTHRACLVLPGSKSTGNDHQGSPGTWEAPTSPSQIRIGRPEPTTPRPPVGRPRPRGANHGRNDGIGPRRQRSGPRRTAGIRSVP